MVRATSLQRADDKAWHDMMNQFCRADSTDISNTLLFSDGYHVDPDTSITEFSLDESPQEDNGSIRILATVAEQAPGERTPDSPDGQFLPLQDNGSNSLSSTVKTSLGIIEQIQSI